MDIFDCGFLFYCLLVGRKEGWSWRREKLGELKEMVVGVVGGLGLPGGLEGELKDLLGRMVGIYSGTPTS